MDTEKLFYGDSYIKEFFAEVISCEKVKNGYAVILDRSAFYPEGGGQPGDTGFIDKVKVFDTTEKDGKILHFAEKSLETGKKVFCEIDWDRRFSLMQQHSGEHIVSGFIHEKFGYDNVGFHMGSDFITIDFNGDISEEELKEIEDKTNRYIWKNLKIETKYITDKESENIEYRSKKAIEGQVRIIIYPDADVCACCGTHVNYTGEIGIVKIISRKKFRDGVRVEMLCGDRAMDYVNRAVEQNRKISNLLSAKIMETASHVQRLLDENSLLKQKMAEAEEKSIEEKAKKYADCGNTILFEDSLQPDSVRRLCDAVCKSCGGMCAVFAGNDETGYKYTIITENGDMRSMVKEMNAALSGRGGGKPNFVQGSLNGSRAEIERFFEEKQL